MHLEYIPLKRGRTCGSRTQNDILNPLIYELYLLACTYCPSRLLSALNFFHCEMHFFKAAFLSKSLRKWIQTWLYVFPHFWMAVYLALGFRVDSYFFQSFETAFHCFTAPAAAAEKSTDGLFAVPGINLFFFFFFMMTLEFLCIISENLSFTKTETRLFSVLKRFLSEFPQTWAHLILSVTWVPLRRMLDIPNLYLYSTFTSLCYRLSVSISPTCMMIPSDLPVY